MKRTYLIIVILILCLGLSAYEIGSFSKTFVDPARNNRQIPTTIFYPIDAINPLSTYPYIIYGHGWGGSCDSYGYLTNAVVNLGWIIVYPRTEESRIFYNTTNLARDMAFLKDAFYGENLNFTSPLYNQIEPLAIVGGFSMGGACAVVAASFEPEFASLVTLAAAPITLLNLYPSSINMALSVTMPSVTISGSIDGTAPPNANQVPIYNNLASVYKSFVSLTGQDHPNFYNNPVIYQFLEPWFSYVRTGSVYYIDQYEALLAGYPASVLTYQLMDNLVIDLEAPPNVVIDCSGTSVTLSWDRILEATGYRIFAGGLPQGGFTDVTSQGVITTGSRMNWTASNSGLERQFYYLKAIRE